METTRFSNRTISNITYVEGDLLQSTCQCIVNPVNTVGVMGRGLAKQFKIQYPHMFTKYKQFCDDESFKIGTIMFYRDAAENSKIICLFPTKLHWRDPSKLEYIERGLRAFAKYYSRWNIESVAFPKLGCGLGGLNWEHHVRPIMEKYLSVLPIKVDIYE